MKKLLKSKLFIGIAIALILIFLAFLFLYMILGNDLFGGTAEIVSRILATQIHWYVLGIIVGLVIIALSVLYVFPFFAYILSKVFTYLSIWIVCLKEKHSCKVSRPPFASICGINKQADLQIKTKDYMILVHFIDIPLGFRKTLTIIDENTYIVSSTSPGRVKRIGGGVPGAMVSGGRTTAFFGGEREANGKDKKYRYIPEFNSNHNEYHYIVPTPGYVDAKVIVGNSANDVSAETAVNRITVCKCKTLKKRLKNQLYTPMNGNNK